MTTTTTTTDGTTTDGKSIDGKSTVDGMVDHLRAQYGVYAKEVAERRLAQAKLTDMVYGEFRRNNPLSRTMFLVDSMLEKIDNMHLELELMSAKALVNMPEPAKRDIEKVIEKLQKFDKSRHAVRSLLETAIRTLQHNLFHNEMDQLYKIATDNSKFEDSILVKLATV
jgi:hypothetical protein